MHGFKDTPIDELWLGIVLPAVLTVLIFFNLITMTVYWPTNRVYLFDMYQDQPRVIGTVLFKLGLAGGLVSWFLMANHRPTERLATPGLIVSIVLTLVGLVLFAFGFLSDT